MVSSVPDHLRWAVEMIELTPFSATGNDYMLQSDMYFFLKQNLYTAKFFVYRIANEYILTSNMALPGFDIQTAGHGKHLICN